jgi:hypothetical protein
LTDRHIKKEIDCLTLAQDQADKQSNFPKEVRVTATDLSENPVKKVKIFSAANNNYKINFAVHTVLNSKIKEKESD